MLPGVICSPSPYPGGSDGKASAYNLGDLGSVPGSERSPGEGNSNPLRYSFLGNFVDRRVLRATVYGVTKELDTTERLNNNKKPS